MAEDFVLASIAGGVAFLVLVALVFGLLLDGFFADNTTNVEVLRKQPVLWSMWVSCLAEAALICYALDRSGTLGAVAGAKVGSIVGLLAWSAGNFILLNPGADLC